MRIAGQDLSTNVQRTETPVRSSDVSRTQSPEEVGSGREASNSDKVELSSQARTIQRTREVAQDAPEVREERVEQARQALQNETLTLQGTELANALLRDAQQS